MIITTGRPICNDRILIDYQCGEFYIPSHAIKPHRITCTVEIAEELVEKLSAAIRQHKAINPK